MTTDMFISLVRKYTRAKKLTPRMLNELVEKIEVFNAEKVNGVMGAAAPHSLQLRGHHRDSKRTSFADTRCVGEYKKRRSCELRPL